MMRKNPLLLYSLLHTKERRIPVYSMFCPYFHRHLEKSNINKLALEISGADVYNKDDEIMIL